MTKNIINFPSRPPANLSKLLNQGHWDDLFGLLGTGIYGEVLVEGYLFPLSILRYWSIHNAETGGSVSVLPENYVQIWLANTPSSFQEISRVAVLIWFGQWKAAFALANEKEAAVSDLWSSAMIGYFERCPSSLKTLYTDTSSGLSVDLPILDPEAVSENESWRLRSFMAKIKTNSFFKSAGSWYSRGDLFDAIMGHQNHLVESFLRVGANFSPIDQHAQPDQMSALNCLLFAAIQSSNEKAISMLLEYDVAPVSPLDCFVVCSYSGQEGVFDMLSRQLPARDVAPCLALALAAAVSGSQIKMAKKIVAHGGSLKMISDEGYTLLHQAALNGTVSVIVWLLEEELLWTSLGRDGLSPKDILKRNQPDIFDVFFPKISKIVYLHHRKK